jgi:ferritin-like metal-binding protein YciE
MGFLTKPIKNLDDLFVHTLQDILYAEQRITKALPGMIQKVSDPQLQNAFRTHLEETKGQIKRLERVFQMHQAEAKAVTCPAIDGIIEEAEEIMSDSKDAEVLDAAALAAAQAVEHYEIARYGTLIAWARQLGRSDCASVLEPTLDEEKAADQKLTAIAEARVNRVAV